MTAALSRRTGYISSTRRGRRSERFTERRRGEESVCLRGGKNKASGDRSINRTAPLYRVIRKPTQSYRGAEITGPRATLRPPYVSMTLITSFVLPAYSVAASEKAA